MTSIRRKLFFLLTALLALPMQAQVNLVYVDSARVARLLPRTPGWWQHPLPKWPTPIRFLWRTVPS